MRLLPAALLVCACAAPVSADVPASFPAPLENDCYGDGFYQPVDCTLQLDAFAERIGRHDIRECLAGAMLLLVPAERIGDQCGYPGDASIWGCYEPDELGIYWVIVRDDLSEADHAFTWDHELRHRASDCANGDWDFHHTGEFFR